MSKVITSASYERETICDYLAPVPMSHANREKFEDEHMCENMQFDERFANLEEHVKACRCHFSRYINLIPDGMETKKNCTCKFAYK